MSQKPLILVTNDDGINAPGIRFLIDVMKEIGEVVVVAPDSPQSAMGHAITINSTLSLEKIKNTEVPEYACSGTPVDCVKIALAEVLDRRPDLCVSGINHGSNSSINVIYSGTMSAAVEAGIEGIPAVGFSLLDFSWNADFTHTRPYVKKIAEQILAQGIQKGVVLNVNLPKENIKGIKVCRQAKASWEESFDKRLSPHGKEYYWLSGQFVNHDVGEDTDVYALENNYVSIVPVQFDLTAYHAIQPITNWDLKDVD
ncbi:5'/3'-nucleotidase SurE [Flavobacterium agricola]|uniref:5'-nucleotidase SurE n=1 Tax=Flavobacterium agricola TaxID=2870839 RepID=A0ABY6LYG4_9FLAO|nr:5'/3'-nucleotidase SurE [Flavobacterium agricola]UYW01331.1 5'/3'-nucleotidase SurE [Flavobacterium agricola]